MGFFDDMARNSVDHDAELRKANAVGGPGFIVAAPAVVLPGEIVESLFACDARCRHEGVEALEAHAFVIDLGDVLIEV